MGRDGRMSSHVRLVNTVMFTPSGWEDMIFFSQQCKYSLFCLAMQDSPGCSWVLF